MAKNTSDMPKTPQTCQKHPKHGQKHPKHKQKHPKHKQKHPKHGQKHFRHGQKHLRHGQKHIRHDRIPASQGLSRKSMHKCQTEMSRGPLAEDEHSRKSLVRLPAFGSRAHQRFLFCRGHSLLFALHFCLHLCMGLWGSQHNQ